MHLATGLWSAFVTLFVTIAPIDTAAAFLSVTQLHKQDRVELAGKSVCIAGAMLLVFALFGNVMLGLLRVSLPAFEVAGGILLFLQAISFTFSRSGLSSINENEQHEAQTYNDIAVFLLAFPLITGPGSLSAILLLMGRVNGVMNAAAIIILLIFCLILTFAAMLVAERLIRSLGRTGTDVVGRISGLLLAALAIQFTFDGLKSAFAVLR